MNAHRAALLRIAFAIVAMLQAARMTMAANDGPIVYSARYYNPSPTTPGTTYWHLYRINSDGTGRRQITFGSYDDSSPRWSPDGKSIAFLRSPAHKGMPRDEPGSLRITALAVVSAASGHVQTLHSFKDMYYEHPVWSDRGNTLSVTVFLESVSPSKTSTWRFNIRNSHHSETLPASSEGALSPNGHFAIVTLDSPQSTNIASSEDREGVRSFASGTISPLPVDSSNFVWYDSRTVMGVTRSSTPRQIVECDLIGHTLKRISLQQKEDIDNRNQGVSIEKDPRHFGAIFCTASGGETTMGEYTHYYQVDLATGQIRRFTDGQFLTWSPDHKKFCTIVNRDGVDYGHRDGQDRSVWVQPLLVGDSTTGKVKAIVDGLVYVVGADWRPR